MPEMIVFFANCPDCRDHLLVTYDVARIVWVFQHGRNPEHRTTVSKYDVVHKGKNLAEYLEEWTKRIHVFERGEDTT